MRILLVSQTTPYLPCHDDHRLRVARLVGYLAGRHRVALIAQASPSDTPQQRRWAASLCSRTDVIEPSRWVSPWSGAPAEGLERMRRIVARAIDTFAPDVLALEGGILAPLARLGRVPTVLALGGSRALRAREVRRLSETPWSWARARILEHRESTWETRWFRAADLRVVLSEEDHGALTRLGAPTAVIPMGVDTQHCEFRRRGQPDRIVFTGTLSWPPNIDAACWFARTILPRIRQRRPRTEFVVAGEHATPTVRALGALPGVRVTGTMPDVRPTLWGAAVAVSPVRAGLGMNNRVLEAMALGTPVVASPGSLAGLAAVVPGQHLLVAENADEFIAGVLAVLEEPARGERLARAARALVERTYDWPVVARQYEAVLSRVAGATPARVAA